MIMHHDGRGPPATVEVAIDACAPFLEPDEGAAGDVFGAYRIVARLARGGVGTVYRARPIGGDEDRDVALKILRRDLASDPQMVALFRREAYILSMLQHPCIVRTFEAGVEDGQLFIALEYVDGCDLYSLLQRLRQRSARIPKPLSLYMAMEVLRGLVAAHELRDADGDLLHIVHRDLKPSNVLLSFSGQVRLSDFGVAAFSVGAHAGSTDSIGTVGYLAPEQQAGASLDRRTDVFGLGIVLYEMLTGRTLFHSGDRQEALARNRRAEVPPLNRQCPDIGADVAAVVHKALALQPEHRFQDAQSMLEALGRVTSPDPGQRLGVAAVVRDTFLGRYKESVFGEPLRPKAGEGGGRPVCLLMPTEGPRYNALQQPLVANGFACFSYADPTALGDDLAGGLQPTVVLVGMPIEESETAIVLEQLARAQRLAPIIGVASPAEDILSATLSAGFDLGAIDLLFEPVRVPRLLCAVETASRARREATPTTGAVESASVPGEGAPAHTFATRRATVLLVSPDPALAERHSVALSDWGWHFDVARDFDEATARLSRKSYIALIYDAGSSGVEGCRAFVQQLRSAPGIGMLPVLGLVGSGDDLGNSGLRRVVLRKRTDQPVLVASGVQELLLTLRGGRAFARKPVHLSAEIRFGVRRVQARIFDVSRLGIGLSCPVAPTVGSKVTVAVCLPGLDAGVETTKIVKATGFVARVGLVQSQDELCHIGVVLATIEEDHESLWVDFVNGLPPS